MKILQINTVCGTGSHGRIATELYKILLNQNHKGLIAYGRGSSTKEINSYRIGSDFDNKTHGVLTRIYDKHGFGSLNATKTLIKSLNTFNPDIIHLHNIHGYYINIEVLFNYLKEADKPVIWTLHDCWSFTGHCAYFDYVNCKRWKNQCFSCPQKNKYPSSWLFDNSQWNYTQKKNLFTAIKNMTLITPSLWLASLVKDSFLGAYPLEVINNGINLEAFQPTTFAGKDIEQLKEKYGCTSEFVILGVASVWEERKGMRYLLELAEKLGENYSIIIVGVNEKQMSDLPRNVVGVKRTNDVFELADLYTMADVFINPTLEDNLPTTNIEALACGTPVITFNTGGSPECIDETCGIVVEKGSIEGLVEAINTIKENPISKEACLNRAKLFNKDDKFQEYIYLYEKLLS